MKSKFKYKDWLNHRVLISGHGGKFVYSKDDDFSIVRLCDLEESERSKIQVKQKELFEKKRDELLDKWKDAFTRRFLNSSLKTQLVADTISDWEEILFNKNLLQYRYDDIVVFELRNQRYEFTAEGLFTIQEYVQNIIKGGRDREYDFIHAPNCPYEEKNIAAPSQVYAQAAFDYLTWLKDTYLISGLPKVVSINEAAMGGKKVYNKILCQKTPEELIAIIQENTSNGLIKDNGLRPIDLCYTCFYFEGDYKESNNKLQFLRPEKEMLGFFQKLGKETVISFPNLTDELLRLISLNCLNKKGNPYKIKQLQTTIQYFGLIPKKKS